MKSFLIFGLGLCGLVFLARGEVLELDIEQAVAMALRNNRTLAGLREERENAAGRIQEARSAALPHLDLSASYARVDEVPTFGEGAQAIPMGQLNNSEAKLDAAQLLYSGGGVRAALRAARFYRGATENRIDHARGELTLAVHDLFNRVLLAGDLREAASEAVALAERNHREVGDRLEQGVARRFDLLRAEEQLTRARAELTSARTGEDTSRLNLLNLLALPLDTNLKLSGKLNAERNLPSLEDGLQEALDARNDLAALRKTANMSREGVVTARSERKPQVALFGQLKRANPSRDFEDEWEDSWMVGIRAEWALFDGPGTRGRVRQATSRERQAQLAADDLEAEILLQVQTTYAQLQSSRELVDARVLALAQAEEALELAEAGYREGVQQQLDVLQAQTARSAARAALAQARYQDVMALRSHEFNLGRFSKTYPTKRR